MTRRRAIVRAVAALAGAAAIVTGASVVSHRSTHADWVDRVEFTTNVTSSDFVVAPAPGDPVP